MKDPRGLLFSNIHGDPSSVCSSYPSKGRRASPGHTSSISRCLRRGLLFSNIHGDPSSVCAGLQARSPVVLVACRHQFEFLYMRLLYPPNSLVKIPRFQCPLQNRLDGQLPKDDLLTSYLHPQGRHVAWTCFSSPNGQSF